MDNTYAEAVPPGLVAPTSPSAARTVDMEKDRLSEVLLALASLMTCWRSILEVCVRQGEKGKKNNCGSADEFYVGRELKELGCCDDY